MGVAIELNRLCQCCGLVGVLAALLLTLMTQDMLLPTPELPVLPDKWWSIHPRPAVGEDTSIRQFELDVSEETLKDLHTRIDLDLQRIAPPLQDSAFEYGANSKYVREFAQYWKDTYSWRKWENTFNSIPQFLTNISGIEVHFMHIKPDRILPTQRVVPVLLVHGWPGSLVEFLQYIPLLVAGDSEVAVEVIAPHIPGYGFSSAPAFAGFSALETAKMFKELMQRLGHYKFYTQGGDWGSVITTALATLYPASVLGMHLNMPVATTPGSTLKNILLQLPLMKYLLLDAEDYHKVNPQMYIQLLQETGYLHIQATKPDTVGMALSSSPVGLAAYILEKFSTWTNPAWTALLDGGLGNSTISRDAMLTNIMIYWLSNCIAPSQRFYKENIDSASRPGGLLQLGNIPAVTPTGIADTPHEIFLVPRAVLKGKFPNIIHYSRFESGGHFVAMEMPEAMATDVLQFIKTVKVLRPRGLEL